MSQQLIIDPRLPKPQLPESDPAYPPNLVRNITMIMNQAVADTKYDIIPPPRIEAFSKTASTNKFDLILQFVAILVALVSIGYATRPLPLWQRIGSAVIAIGAIRYILQKFKSY